MLQSILPNNPEVSYLHLAVNRAEALIENKKVQAIKENGNLLIEEGFVCESINLAKISGGVCQRKDVALEQMMFRPSLNQFNDSDNLQLQVFSSVTNYYDGILRDFKKAPKAPSKASLQVTSEAPAASAPGASESKPVFRNFFDKIISGVKGFVSGLVSGLKKREDKKPDVPVREINLEDHKIVQEEIPPKKVEEKAPEKVPEKMEGELQIERRKPDEKEKNAKILDDKAEKFELYKKMLNKVIEENKDKYAQKACEKIDRTNSEKVLKNMLIRLQNAANANKDKLFPDHDYYVYQEKLGHIERFHLNGALVVDPVINVSVLKLLESDYLTALTSDIKKPANAEVVFKEALLKVAPKTPTRLIEELLSDLSPEDRELLNQDYKRYVDKDYSSCAPMAKLNYYKKNDGLVKDFVGAGCPAEFLKHVINLQQMVVGLDKLNFDNVDKLNDFISNIPNMSYDKVMMELIAPSCSDDKRIPIPSNVNCTSKILTYPGAPEDNDATTAKHLSTMKTHFAEATLKSLNKNRSVGVSFCTRFMDQNMTDDFYLKSKVCDVKNKNRLHAATLIGYKCEQGSLKYLMQNSWGAWNGANYRFEKDSYGKAWIKEEELVKNSYLLDLLD
jgi:hypothetical protein